MDPKLTLRNLLAGNTFYLEQNHRPYTWQTELDYTTAPKQVNLFLTQIKNHFNSGKPAKYYSGHFLLLQKDSFTFVVQDGSQRLTTLQIFLSALFSKIKKIRALTKYEIELKEDLLKRKEIYRFNTVECDNAFFRTYIIDQRDKTIRPESKAQENIKSAFDYFENYLDNKSVSYLVGLLEFLQNTECTMHIIDFEFNAHSQLI